MESLFFKFMTLSNPSYIFITLTAVIEINYKILLLLLFKDIMAEYPTNSLLSFMSVQATYYFVFQISHLL